MPNFSDIIYTKHHRVRGAAWITINRPDVMNSFTGRTLTEMREAVRDAGTDDSVGVLVITGAGDDEDAHGVVGAGISHGLAHFGEGPAGEGVHDVRAVDGDPGGAADTVVL